MRNGAAITAMLEMLPTVYSNSWRELSGDDKDLLDRSRKTWRTGGDLSEEAVERIRKLCEELFD